MPKVNVKAEAKSDASSKAVDAAKVAARLKIVESSASRLVPMFSTHLSLSDKVKKSMFEIFESTKKEVEKNTLDKTETSKMLTIALAKVYTDGDESAVSANMTANTLKSKFLRLCHPVDAKAAKELAKALDKGVDFNQALLVARGKQTAAETQKKGKKGGERQKGGNAIEDEETFGNLLSALIVRALDGGEDFPKFKGGLDLDKIEEVFSTVLAGYRTKLEAGPEAQSSDDDEND